MLIGVEVAVGDTDRAADADVGRAGAVALGAAFNTGTTEGEETTTVALPSSGLVDGLG